MYSATTYPEPNAMGKAVATIGAGPPANTDANWKPIEAPLYRSVRRRKTEPGEHQRSHLAVEQEVAGFDRRADRARDHGPAKLHAVLGFAQAGYGGCGGGRWMMLRPGRPGRNALARMSVSGMLRPVANQAGRQSAQSPITPNDSAC
jgi:hypothetical protein